VVTVPSATRRNGDTKEFIALALLVQRWDEIAPFLVEALFAEDVTVRAFRALAATAGALEAALVTCDPEARDLLERAAVVDVDELDVDTEARQLINAAVRRALARRTHLADPEQIREDVEVRRMLEDLDAGDASPEVADHLLAWLDRRVDEVAAGR
jgi:hypothetical protein